MKNKCSKCNCDKTNRDLDTEWCDSCFEEYLARKSAMPVIAGQDTKRNPEPNVFNLKFGDKV